MDKQRIAAMADRIAQKENDDPLVQVDMAVDALIAAIETISEQLPKVQTDNAEQKEAVEKVTDLMETAVAPYTLDIVKALDVFGTE